MMSRVLRVEICSEKMTKRIPREEYQGNGSDVEQAQSEKGQALCYSQGGYSHTNAVVGR